MTQISAKQANQLIAFAKNSALAYSKLIGKEFCILCEDSSEYTIRFFQDDFLHLTGMQTTLSPLDFFTNSYCGTLTRNNILSTQKYNWKTLFGKGARLEKIDELLYKSGNKTLLLDGLITHTQTFPVGIKNDVLDTCVGFVGHDMHARSLRRGTNSGNAKKILAIDYIFAKPVGSLKLTELVYINQGTKLTIPEIIKSRLSSDLLQNLATQKEESHLM